MLAVRVLAWSYPAENASRSAAVLQRPTAGRCSSPRCRVSFPMNRPSRYGALMAGLAWPARACETLFPAGTIGLGISFLYLFHCDTCVVRVTVAATVAIQ